MTGDLYTILALVVLILLSAYFSATETAFSAFNGIRMKNLAAKGNKRAATVISLSDRYDRLLSTILVGNNIVNISAASLATVLFVRHFGAVGAAISTVVITVVVLIFGEITHKSIAKDMPEKFAMFAAPLIHFLCVLLLPVTWLFALWKKLLRRIFKIRGDENGITEEEILTMVREAEEEGGIDEEAGELIRSAIEFDDLDAIDVCTPRIDIEAVEEGTPAAEIMALFNSSGYSRLPVYRQSIDNINGVINQKDFYNRVVNGKEPLAGIISPILCIPPGTKISKLMRMLQQKHSHMAFIVDEYGGIMGLVTLEDIIEELIGEIWDEHDQIVHEIEEISPGVYKVLGGAHPDKFFETFDMNDEEIEANSVNGWLMERFEHIPAAGETLDYKNLHIEVIEATDRRVEELKVTRRSSGDAEFDTRLEC